MLRARRDGVLRPVHKPQPCGSPLRRRSSVLPAGASRLLTVSCPVPALPATGGGTPCANGSDLHAHGQRTAGAAKDGKLIREPALRVPTTPTTPAIRPPVQLRRRGCTAARRAEPVWVRQGRRRCVGRCQAKRPSGATTTASCCISVRGVQMLIIRGRRRRTAVLRKDVGCTRIGNIRLPAPVAATYAADQPQAGAGRARGVRAG